MHVQNYSANTKQVRNVAVTVTVTVSLLKIAVKDLIATQSDKQYKL